MGSLAGRKKRRRTKEYGPGFAERNLLHVVLKFDGGFNSRHRSIAGIEDIASEIGYFLMNKTFRAAHFEISELQFGRIGLFSGAKRKARFGERGRRSGPAEEQQID